VSSRSRDLLGNFKAELGFLLLQAFNLGGNVHKLVTTFVVMALAIAMTGCSSSSNGSTNINGNWSASLTNSPTGSPIYTFSTTFTETSGGGVSVTNFTFNSSNGSCLTGQTTETGSFTLSGNFNGSVMGTFGMTITSQDAGGQDVLTLQGGVSPNNTITGNWSVTGTTACVGQGTFVITKA
jgi:hypothetical protein